MAEAYLKYELFHQYYSDQAYPYRYFDVSPLSGNLVDSGTITIQYTFRHYSSWSNPRIAAINWIEIWFYDASGNLLDFENASGYSSTSINGASGSTTIDLSRCTNQYKATAAQIDVLIEAKTYSTNPSGTLDREVLVGNSYEQVPVFTLTHVSHVGAPTAVALASTLSRNAVELSWGAGSAGTGNSVTGYDVEQQDCADGVSWPSAWQTAAGSPVSANKLSVMPPDTPGYFRRFRVRTRGSAGSDYYSGWVVSENTLRRKWNAFGAWTDSALVARSSMIRAVHLSEIQARVNVIRAFYGLGAYSFTPVTARATKVARWDALIQELRTAIDGISADHEAWNTLEAGKPRIAHVAQLRRVIDNM